MPPSNAHNSLRRKMRIFPKHLNQIHNRRTSQKIITQILTLQKGNPDAGCWSIIFANPHLVFERTFASFLVLFINQITLLNFKNPSYFQHFPSNEFSHLLLFFQQIFLHKLAICAFTEFHSLLKKLPNRFHRTENNSRRVERKFLVPIKLQ